MNKVNILDIPIHKATLNQTADLLMNWINTKQKAAHIVTANSEILYQTTQSYALHQILLEAKLVTADGMGVVWASRIFNDPLPERVAGYDLLLALCARMAKQKHSIFLLGAQPGVAQKAAEVLQQRFPGLQIAGIQHGYYSPEDEAKLIAQINAIQPDVLFVALGAPRAEFWIKQHIAELQVSIAMGVGGSFDVLAGKVKRAPIIWQKAGLEWAYRLVKEPKRAARMTSLPKFGLLIIKKKIFKGRK